MAIKSKIARKRRHRRIRNRISGTAERPRLNVFRSLDHIYAQVDKALRGDVAGKPKKEQASMVGKAVAERAKAAGISTVLFDRGGYLYHGRIKALADGAREGGLDF